ncbi:hypothetical protein BC936DRAFT_140067 [Jimgerdemannia flammicorona]|uniref:Uncharacterized protein n=1 Tax=Jimgerdemannia flammicorona TaxID=994334 RepID=A0A433B3X0_9FUNG|nr:hypothetical protein BC936DRAFT_140067 [Jimgerdemannia flammicorona]
MYVLDSILDGVSFVSGHDKAALGANGQGYFWVERIDEDDEEDPRNKKVTWLAYDPADIPVHDTDDAESASEVGEPSDDEGEELVFNDDFGDGDGVMPSSAAARAAEDFKREVRATVDRALAENHSVESAALELHTLRMAFNGNYENVREVVVPVLMEKVDPAKVNSSMKGVIARWGQLLKKVMYSLEDQVHALFVLQVRGPVGRDGGFVYLVNWLRLTIHLQRASASVIARNPTRQSCSPARYNSSTTRTSSRRTPFLLGTRPSGLRAWAMRRVKSGIRVVSKWSAVLISTSLLIVLPGHQVRRLVAGGGRGR